MAFVTGSKDSFTVKAYIGDNKTLLAFNFSDETHARNLAGFTIKCEPPGLPAYYLWNDLQFEVPSKHAQVPGEKPESTANAPIQKYRWTHVIGTNHQGTKPVVGNYTYTVTPRFFDDKQSMQPLDNLLSVTVTVPVGPFRKGPLALGFTRGYMQSQAFAHHFGNNTPIVPAGKPLQFDTSAVAGTNNDGQQVKFADIYDWMGSTAREQVFSILNAVVADPSLQLDVFAYDLDEPDVVTIFLKLAAQGRIRIILDNAELHVTHKDPKTGKTVVPPEDPFTDLFKQQAKAPAEIVRGSFGRYSHDKVFIVKKNGAATRVLTGSTNFSVTGLYVNANHVLVFDDANVAATYAKVFEQSWQVLSQFKTPSTKAAGTFSTTALATQPFTSQPGPVPRMSITFSPHTTADVTKILGGISSRITGEASTERGNVLFAVMQLTGSNTPVYNTLNQLHANQSLFSYGISDAPQGTYLHAVGTKTGVLVTGKPGRTTLPPPFDQVPVPPGHEIHDKFVVCGLNGKDPVVYCGSSNLATGGEGANGDNLLEIHDADVATAFAIEALLLVDHYAFLDRYANPKSPRPANNPGGNSRAKKASGGNTRSKPAAKKTAAKKTAAKKSAQKRPSRKSGATKSATKTAAKTGAKKKSAGKSRR
jgi:phospholipase D-like protein